MNTLFAFDRTQESFFAGCGLTQEDVIRVYRALNALIENDILEFAEVRQRTTEGDIEQTEYQVNLSKPELAQTMAESLNRELTPEISFALGVIIGDIRALIQKNLQHLTNEGRI